MCLCVSRCECACVACFFVALGASRATAFCFVRRVRPSVRVRVGACVHPSYTRSSYYNADTADLEIGQEFEDAEAEGEAALELQRASYKGLDAADYGEEEDGEEGDGGDEGDAAAKARRSRKGKGKDKSRATAHGAALSAMKSDLEQIALGGVGEVFIRAFVLFLFI